MFIQNERHEFTVKEICLCLDKTSQEVRGMLIDSGSQIEHKRYGGSQDLIARADINALMVLHENTPVEEKLGRLLVS